MRFKYSLLTFSLIVLITIACDNDDDLKGIPSLAPNVKSVNVGIGTLVFAGVPTDVSATIQETEKSPLSAVLFEVFQLNGMTALKNGTIEDDFEEGENVVVWSGAESGIGDLTTGDYILQVTATDTDGNKTIRSAKFTVPDYVIPDLCQEEGKVTVVLLTNSDTPDDVGLVGSITGWGGQADIAMHKIKNGVFCAAAPLVEGAEYKFRRQSNWGLQEKQDNCNDGNNKVYRTTQGTLVVISVPKWGGVGC
ncbi:hypothetical protein [Pseudochryseolinea flava]|uniref:Uncharacterized protein n=1 Tax=Pseudochryseolinea flava TaxID=2059302 RepID=A0A364Y2S6_9BACT|nr:hypothetical protein [Pseudochryseolinea flava]RAW01213.1 hypothetical protein DQQ10_09875 [Pseudochryseolinea flava]